MHKPSILPLRTSTKLIFLLAIATTITGILWQWDTYSNEVSESGQTTLPGLFSKAKENSADDSVSSNTAYSAEQNRMRNPDESAQPQSSAKSGQNNDIASIKDEKEISSTSSATDDTNQYRAGVQVVPLAQQNFPKDYIKSALDMQRDIAQQMQTKGYVEAEDYAVLIIKAEAQELANNKSTLPESWTEKLGFHPVDLQGTELAANSKYIGLIPSKSMLQETSNQMENTSSEKNIARLYQSDNLGLVKLTEHVHNQPPVITPEFMNDKVSGIPAYYYVQKSSDGGTLATLTWVTASRGYTLESTLDVTKSAESKDMFFNLANSIPVN